MPKAFATLVDEVERKLEDSSNVIWSAANLGLDLEDAIREASEYKPHVMEYTYVFESRTGMATATTSNALVDTTESQFLSTDVDKVIYNTTDRTWAIVTAFVSTSQLTLSKDIMASSENYEMFNKGCRTKYQINIEDITDYVGPAERGVIKLEYPLSSDSLSYDIWYYSDLYSIDTQKNFRIEGDILTVDVWWVPDSKPDTPANDVEVRIWVEARQRVSQLTDLSGLINNGSGIAAGSTSIAIDGLSGTEIVAEDTLFTIASVRGIYRVTADVTLSSGGGTVVVHPALLDAATDEDVVTFIGSTLDSELERMVVELTTARAATQKSIDYIDQINKGGQSTPRDFEAWGERRLGLVLSQLERLRNRRPPRTKKSHSRYAGGYY